MLSRGPHWSGPWPMNWLLGLASNLRCHCGPVCNHWAVSDPVCYHWTWSWLADLYLAPGLALNLIHHYEFVWWLGLLVEPGHHPPACPAHLAQGLVRLLLCWSQDHSWLPVPLEAADTTVPWQRGLWKHLDIYAIMPMSLLDMNLWKSLHYEFACSSREPALMTQVIPPSCMLLKCLWTGHRCIEGKFWMT